MPKVNSIQRISTYAKEMLNCFTNDKAGKTTYTRNFFREANASHNQSNAMIAYYTEFNKLGKDKTKNLGQTITDVIKGNPEIHKEARTFFATLCKDYPKTLGKRLSLAYKGEVVADKVNPATKKNKLIVALDELYKQFMKEE